MSAHLDGSGGLEDAVAALRAAGDDAVADDLATRDRIVASLRHRHVVRRRVATMVATLAAMLLGSTAYAWYSGWLPRRIEAWRGGESAVSPAPTPGEVSGVRTRRRGAADRGLTLSVEPDVDPAIAPAAPTANAPSAPTAIAPTAPTAIAPTAAAPIAPTAPAAVAPSAPAAIAPTAAASRRALATASAPAAPDAVAPRPERTGPRVEHRPRSTPSQALSGSPSTPAATTSEAPVSAPSASAAAPAAPPADDAELADYRVAHRIHFSGGDPAAALAAWDRYLAVWPTGRLAPEAGYNRALCLVRLHRWDEAAAALAPFAAGTSGGYRQEEARHLLDVVRARAAKP